MRNVAGRYTGLSVVLVTSMPLVGCRAKGAAATADTTSPAMSVIAPDSSASARSALPENGATLSDANIVAMLDEANMADSALGATALSRTTNPDVKDFARLMMGEHHALRVMVQDLARKQAITPQLPANDPFPAAVQGERSAIDAASGEHAFDSTYIDHEIGIHQAVIDWAGSAYGQAQNPALKDLIKAAGPTLQKHLDHAHAIQKALVVRSTAS